MATLERALQIAAKAHQGQLDRAGLAYILHPLRVMMKMDSQDAMITAILHDVIEDSEWTMEDLRREQFSETVLNAVDCLTRRPGESYDSYIERVRTNPLAIRVKLGDLEDNMTIKRLKHLGEKDCQRLQRYFSAYLKLKPEKTSL